jgi:hypothetical protein
MIFSFFLIWLVVLQFSHYKVIGGWSSFFENFSLSVGSSSLKVPLLAKSADSAELAGTKVPLISKSADSAELPGMLNIENSSFFVTSFNHLDH